MAHFLKTIEPRLKAILALTNLLQQHSIHLWNGSNAVPKATSNNVQIPFQMDQRTFVFATSGHCIKDKQCQHVAIKIICVFVQNNLAYFPFMHCPLVANPKPYWSIFHKTKLSVATESSNRKPFIHSRLVTCKSWVLHDKLFQRKEGENSLELFIIGG